jgi:hypothetical protein
VVARRSARLVKKATHRTPAITTAQNLLMQKLGLLSAAEVVLDDLERYSKLFTEGLSKEQVLMIQDLFMHHVPEPELEEIVEEKQA